MGPLSLRALLALLLVGTSWGFPATTGKPTRVVITGAGDSVGKALFKKLVAKSGRFEPIALVRTEKARRELLALPGVTPGQVRVGDITNRESIHGLFHGASKAVLCTSATPTRSLAFRVKNFFRSLVGRTRAPRLSELKYPKGQDPYHVDFLGQRHVIDECVRDNVEHIVMLANMGGYQAASKVNLIGQVEGDAHSGNLLKWKRAAERYLMKRCFFTIIHAGALTDDPGGRREIVFDNDDALLRAGIKRIPKEDCAEVLLQALLFKEAIGRSIDVAARAEGTRTQGLDWMRFWSIPGENVYPADL